MKVGELYLPCAEREKHDFRVKVLYTFKNKPSTPLLLGRKAAIR